MRTDEEGTACPETLGEYRDLCAALMPDSAAVEYLDELIADAPSGREEKVITSDYNMRLVLFPLLVKPKKGVQSPTP